MNKYKYSSQKVTQNMSLVNTGELFKKVPKPQLKSLLSLLSKIPLLIFK